MPFGLNGGREQIHQDNDNWVQIFACYGTFFVVVAYKFDLVNKCIDLKNHV